MYAHFNVQYVKSLYTVWWYVGVTIISGYMSLKGTRINFNMSIHTAQRKLRGGPNPT